MITILSGGDRTVAPETFQKLYRLRHDVFISHRGWSVPSRNGLDIDQYDTRDAIYFFDTGNNGRIVSHVRLTSTMNTSLLADCFPHLVDDRYTPRGQTVMEATRFIALPRDGGTRTKRTLEAELFSAMVRWCLANRVTHVQAILEDTLLPTFLELAPQTFPLGLPGPYAGGPGAPGGGVCIAVRCPMNERTLKQVIEYANLTTEVDIDAYGLGPKVAA